MNMQITRERRAEIERQIDELIDLLDIVDGDPDLEDNGDRERDLDMDESDGDAHDEPWLSWGEYIDQTSPARFGEGTFDSDREVDGDEADYSRAEDEFGTYPQDMRSCMAATEPVPVFCAIPVGGLMPQITSEPGTLFLRIVRQ